MAGIYISDLWLIKAYYEIGKKPGNVQTRFPHTELWKIAKKEYPVETKGYGHQKMVSEWLFYTSLIINHGTAKDLFHFKMSDFLWDKRPFDQPKWSIFKNKWWVVSPVDVKSRPLMWKNYLQKFPGLHIQVPFMENTQSKIFDLVSSKVTFSLLFATFWNLREN